MFAVLNHFCAGFQVLLEDVGIGGLDSLVVILFKINNFEAELLVEFDRADVVHLYVSKTEWFLVISTSDESKGIDNLQEYVIEASIGFDVLENVIEHHCSNPQASVRIEAAEGHNVEASLIRNGINPTANSTNDDIIVIGEFRELSRL